MHNSRWTKLALRRGNRIEKNRRRRSNQTLQSFQRVTRTLSINEPKYNYFCEKMLRFCVLTRGDRLLCVTENIFDGRTRNRGIGFRPKPGRFGKPGTWLVLRSEGRCALRGVDERVRAGRGDLPLRQHRESAHLARTVQLRLQDPPTPTGDEKGRENERRESLRGITVVAFACERGRSREKEREGRRRGERTPGC